LQQLFIVGIYACKSQFNIPDSTAENKKTAAASLLKRLP